MTTLLLIVTLTTNQYDPHYGYVSYYDESPTIATLDYRLASGDLNHKHVNFADAYIAVADCDRMGERGYMTINGSEPIAYVVYDCANRSDETVQWMVDSNIVAELDYNTTAKYVPNRDGAIVRLKPINN